MGKKTSLNTRIADSLTHPLIQSMEVEIYCVASVGQEDGTRSLFVYLLKELG